MENNAKSSALRVGVITFVILAVLTAIEYVIAVTLNVWPVLVVVALLKAALVLQFFMHLPRVFSGEEGH
jgi:heme/copper-type cytochrome/quinol oxidase subunit 4